jgi:hypothetical protein
MKLKDEPALAAAVLQAILAVAISFGLDLSAEQVGAIVALAAAISALFVRRRVSPTEAAAEPAAPQPTHA